MKKTIFFIILCLLLNVIAFSQKPDSAFVKDVKVGLALSGGGAKGLAHIGLLKMIDSLGIKVDYITGTSMGGILGGLYAMGYSADSLEKITLNLDWQRVLSNKVPLNEINIEEKDEYNNYAIEFPVEDNKPVLPSSLVDGQYMSEVLNTLTYPSRNITDFSKFPIPVQVTSSDIVNGGLIMQQKGSLPLALRSTLAIPAAFSPVIIDGKKLVDGGLDRNFPVEEVLKMGANVVIGGYTGFRLFTEKEIANPLKMIYQTHAIRSLKDSKDQMAKTSVLVDNTTVLYNYTTKDFGKYKQIIEAGKTEARKHIDELKKISALQKSHGIEFKRPLIIENKLPTIKYNFLNEDGTPLENEKEKEIVKYLLDLKEGQYYPVGKVNEAIQRIFGTRFYKKVYYTFTNVDSTGLAMNIYLAKDLRGSFKVAAHYDTEQAAGIILNYTYRNLFFNRSRLIVTMDLAERLKARVNYFKFLTNNNKLWIKPAFEWKNLKSNDIYFKTLNADGVMPESDYFNTNLNLSLALGYSIKRNAAVSAGMELSNEIFKRKLGITSVFISPDVKSSKYLYQHSNNALFINFNQNNLNAEYFSRSGNKFGAEIKLFTNNKYKLSEPAKDDKIGQAIFYSLNPDSTVLGNPGNVIRFAINEKYVQPVSKRLSVHMGAFYGINYSTKYGANDDGYTFLNQKFWLGGYEYKESFENPSFIGLKQKELPQANLSRISLALQYMPLNKLYITPVINYAALQKSWSPFKESSGILGYGVDVGYYSLLGPIHISASKSDIIKSWRFYFSLGYKF